MALRKVYAQVLLIWGTMFVRFVEARRVYHLPLSSSYPRFEIRHVHDGSFVFLEYCFKMNPYRIALNYKAAPALESQTDNTNHRARAHSRLSSQAIFTPDMNTWVMHGYMNRPLSLTKK